MPEYPDIVKNYRREGYTSRICRLTEENMEIKIAEGYKPVLDCKPIIFDIGSGDHGILMEIETWAWELRNSGKTSLEVEKILAERTECRLYEEMAKLSFWDLLKETVRRICPWSPPMRPKKVEYNRDYENTPTPRS